MGNNVLGENGKHPWGWEAKLVLVLGLIFAIGVGFAFAERVGLIHFH